MQHNVPGGAHSVYLATGLPPGHLGLYSGSLKKYYDRQVKFSYYGRKFDLKLQPVICPQGYSVLLAPALTDYMKTLNEDNKLNGAARPIDILVREPFSIIIDIGGGTTDPIPLEEGVPQPTQPGVRLTLDEGSVDVFHGITAAIKVKSGREVSEAAIKKHLEGKPVRVLEEDALIISEHLERYSGKLMMKLSEAKLPFGNSYVLLTGGGSSLIKNHWEKYRDRFGVLDFLTEIKANAMGFEQMALTALMSK